MAMDGQPDCGDGADQSDGHQDREKQKKPEDRCNALANRHGGFFRILSRDGCLPAARRGPQTPSGPAPPSRVYARLLTSVADFSRVGRLRVAPCRIKLTSSKWASARCSVRKSIGWRTGTTGKSFPSTWCSFAGKAKSL